MNIKKTFNFKDKSFEYSFGFRSQNLKCPKIKYEMFVFCLSIKVSRKNRHRASAFNQTYL